MGILQLYSLRSGAQIEVLRAALEASKVAFEPICSLNFNQQKDPMQTRILRDLLGNFWQQDNASLPGRQADISKNGGHNDPIFTIRHHCCIKLHLFDSKLGQGTIGNLLW